MDRKQWGLAGLLAFEAIVASYLLGIQAAPGFIVSYALGAVVLGLALWRGPQRWHFALLALAAGYRAYAQTVGGAPLGVYPTWLVPIGFAWLAVAPRAMPRWAIACVALARTWFIVWYFLPGNLTLVVANVLGAAGAWVWLAAEEDAGGATADEARAAA